jgi:S-disulfanyl-L-cysteine oxidoreductase SoxD
MMARLRLLMLACILALPAAAQDSPPDSARSTRAGIYTAGQATRGREIYELSCVSCHTPASHTGPVFAAKWDRLPLWELYRYVSESMPKSEPGSLTPRAYARVIAYLLKLNGMPAGKDEIPTDSTTLKKIRIELKAVDPPQER